MKAASLPSPASLVSVVVPKSAVPLNVPVTSTVPDGSTAMALPASSPGPPARTAHSTTPEVLTFITNTSCSPALTSVIAPKVALPWK